MFALILNCVLLLLIFHGCDCQRRIKDGVAVDAEKKYMVYLLKASISPQYYEGWLCGGALVSSLFIVTSAACVTDVIHLYAIAGYNKYIRDTEINNDPCTKEKKKKVVFICTPKAYELKYEEIEKWSYIDIAVVKVESPYDFDDTSYATICSYTPAAIPVNYEMKYQEPGVDAIVLGWGHMAKWRDTLDPVDHNQEVLNYAPTLIQNKEDCKKEYAVYDKMEEIIDKYMICTFQKGNINDAGETIIKAEPTAEGCIVPQRKLQGYEGVSCENANAPGEEIVLIENTRKNRKPNNVTSNNVDQKPSYQSNEINSNVVDLNITHNSSLNNKMDKNVLNTRRLRTRREGICQNDHGGPLVTWVGAHEVLIGVASVFKISEDLDCIGPYLFTSTQCNGAFINCILRDDPADIENPSRREICDNSEERGFNLVEKHISWKDHPDGPAENEKNTTTYGSTSNTTTNVTFNLINSKISNLITNTTATYLIKNANPTRTTTAVNLIDTTPKNITNDSSTNLASTTFTNLTNTNFTNVKNALSVILTRTTRAVNLIDTTPKNITNDSSTNLANTTFTNLTDTNFTNVKNALSVILTSATSTNQINVTSTNSTNATFTTLTNASNATNFKNTITTILMKAVTTNLINTTTTKPTPQLLITS